MNKNIAILVVLISMFQPLKGEEDTDKKLTHYYFAYGSNLSYEFLKERLKNGPWVDEWHRSGELEGAVPIDMGMYELADYEFSYSLNVEPFGETGTAGNVVPKKDVKVYGVLYKLSEIHLKELDKTEDEPEAYKRVAVTVHKCAMTTLQPAFQEAWVYVGNPKYVVEYENPDPIYVDLLVQAANKRSFPKEYIQKHLMPK